MQNKTPVPHRSAKVFGISCFQRIPPTPENSFRLVRNIVKNTSIVNRIILSIILVLCIVVWLALNGEPTNDPARIQNTEQELAQAQFNLGSLYVNDGSVSQDLAMAIEWYRKVAEKGDLRAHKKLKELTQ